MSGGGSAPKPDKNIGRAAMKTAQLGEDYLGWMQEQAAISNEWAATDRARQQEVFIPLEDQFIEDAQSYDTPERQAQAAAQATADVRSQSALAQESNRRQMARMGVDPRSGRYAAVDRAGSITEGLAAAGAANTARRTVQAEGRQLKAAAIDMGKGLAVNPATSLGMSNSAISAGAQGAMNGYSSQANTLTNLHNSNLKAYEINSNNGNAMWGAVGSVAGAAMGNMPFFSSSKEVKTDKTPVRRSMLKAVEKMPVEEWTYKEGHGDGGRHIGTYAEDFTAQTGMGDGKTIDVQSGIGVAMGATKELSAKVDKLEALVRRGMSKPEPRKADNRTAEPRKAASSRRQMPRKDAA